VGILASSLVRDVPPKRLGTWHHLQVARYYIDGRLRVAR
jgi:hypothetical protein